MASYDENLQLDNDYTYSTQYPNLVAPQITQNFEGTTVINTINGRGGSNVTFSGGTTGYDFGGSGSTFTLQVVDANAVRTSISAAKSGVNSDITAFTGLTGNTGVNPWTGTPNGSGQSTYPATVAAVAYDQTQMQGLMDKMQDVTEFMMFLVAALLAPGIVET